MYMGMVKVLKIGDVFDQRYRILEILGHGGMGTVYLAENLRLGTRWAVKEILLRSSSSMDLHAEPNILKKLDHPLLPRIYDIVECAEAIYLIVDYIEGQSMQELLREKRCFSEGEVCTWALQLCDVLEYLHGFQPRPIIYRDMKPANIMLTPNGKIKLIDFGIAREYKAHANSDTVYIGTRGYAAPEQYGGGQTGAYTDIYSLGVTLFHMLTGRSPYDPPYALEFMPQDPVSEIFRDIICRCICQNPDQRYASASALKKAFEELAWSHGEQSAGDGSKGSAGRSYPKKIIGVTGSVELACELACIIGSITGLEVLALDASSIPSRMEQYLPRFRRPACQSSEELSQRMDRMEKKTGRTWERKELEAVCTGVVPACNLWFLSGEGEAGPLYKLSPEAAVCMLRSAYRHFDITIVLLEPLVMHAQAIELIQEMDWCITGLEGTLAGLHRHMWYRKSCEEAGSGQEEKWKILLWEYRKELHLPVPVVKRVCGAQTYAGKICFQPARVRYRSRVRACYANHAWRLHRQEYEEILGSLGLATRNGVWKRLQLFLMKPR